MAGYVTGDAAADRGQPHQPTPWFVGHFLDPGDPRRSRDVEIKWGVHPAGDRNAGGFVANRTATSVSILVSGHFRLRFRTEADPEGVRPVDLDRPGRYVLWDPGVAHDWEAVADSVVLTVRWPSIPRDQPAPPEASDPGGPGSP